MIAREATLIKSLYLCNVGQQAWYTIELTLSNVLAQQMGTTDCNQKYKQPLFGHGLVAKLAC